MMRSRAEIDTSAPFRSVKEAVMLFGERVLAGEVYANKLKELQNGANECGNAPSSPKNAQENNEISELEETKQSLQKAREDGMLLATCLSSLQEELERTRRELERIKEQESKNQAIEQIDIIDQEDLKFVEDSSNYEVTFMKEETRDHHDEKVEFQKKRYVTFANPPCLAQVIVVPSQADSILERHPSSLRKKKKKPLIPLIGGIFSKKKGISQVDQYQQAR